MPEIFNAPKLSFVRLMSSTTTLDRLLAAIRRAGLEARSDNPVIQALILQPEIVTAKIAAVAAAIHGGAHSYFSAALPYALSKHHTLWKDSPWCPGVGWRVEYDKFRFDYHGVDQPDPQSLNKLGVTENPMSRYFEEHRRPSICVVWRVACRAVCLSGLFSFASCRGFCVSRFAV